MELYPWTRRELMALLDANPKNVKRLAHEYGVTETTVWSYYRQWKEYKKLAVFFGDLVTRADIDKAPRTLKKKLNST